MSGRSSIASVLLFFLAAGCSKPSGSGAGDGSGAGARQGEPLRIAAAADLALAFGEIEKGFTAKTGKKVEMSFGSTGLLAKQIAEGAPFDVFAAANISFVDDVVKGGACDASTKALYARGRIVVWSKDAAALPKGIDGLTDARYAKIAIANPEHAPYGRAAQEALTKAGVWKTLEPRMVHGENVQQTQVYARTGNADVAIVALSLAVTSDGAYLPIDAELHQPLDQALVICHGGIRTKTNEAHAFVDYVGSPEGRAVMRKYGFLLPGEALPPPSPSAP
jgi:molybdate transport system substrate-binding protein